MYPAIFSFLQKDLIVLGEISSKADIPFKIPENWIWTKIGNLFSYKNGYAYKPSETSKIISDYPIIKSQNLMSLNVIIDSNTSYVENPNEKMLASKVNNGDFLMCLSSQSSNPEPLGKTAIYNLKYNALLNQRVLKLTPFNSIYSKFLFYVINSQYFPPKFSQKKDTFIYVSSKYYLLNIIFCLHFY